MFGLVNYSIAQNNVITEVWLENTGVQSGVFGSPTAVDAADNVYRAGFENQSNGGAIAKLQKIDNEGQLLWTVNLTSTTVDKYEPSKVVTNGSNIYVTGIVTYQSTGQSDFFISKISQSGTLQWLSIDQATGNDVASDLVYDASSSTIYLCGTTERAGSYDMLLASYADNGNQNWLAQRDYTGLADLGAKVFMDGANIVVQGSSQSTTTDWDITSWFYDDGGNYISEQHSGGLNVASDELRDGALNNGFIHLTGVSRSGANYKFKVVCLDATNNILWEDTYDKNSLREEGTALVATSSGFVATGFVTTAAGNEDILIRKYDLSGNALWTREIDVHGANDRGVDIAEDAQGNYIVVSDAQVSGQTDVYMHYIESITGNELWSTAVAQDGAAEENAQSIEVTFGGEMYITYQTEGQAATEAYSYSDVDFPMDNEPFSRGSLIIRNSGQLRNDSGEVVTDVRYYTFGQHPEMYYADQRMSALVLDDDTSTNQVQRIDFDFVNANSTHVGEVTEHERETHFNYYKGADKYEQQGTFDVLAYPGLYPNIDAFVSSNSAGYKMTFVLENGADLDDIEINISGSSGFALSGGNLEVSTIADPINWLVPYSYPKSDVEKANDGCLQYVLSGGHLKLISGCGELSYPYVITLRAGVGAAYAASAIENMDWSTFWGGSSVEVGSDIEADVNGNLYIGGTLSSNGGWRSDEGIINSTTGGKRHGFVAKFNHDGEVEWGTLIENISNNVTEASAVRAIGLYDNNSKYSNEEIHVVGEYVGILNPDTLRNSGIPYGAWQQPSYTQPNNGLYSNRDLFFATLSNGSGTILIQSPFGGPDVEMVFAMDISSDGLMYFAGSTQGGSSDIESSQDPPASYLFPVYNPNDGSYFEAQHPANGSDRGFVSVLDLKTYKLAYSSIITKDSGSTKSEYLAIYGLEVDGGGAFCGRSITPYARLGFFDPQSTVFATSIDAHPNSEWTDRAMFSSVVKSKDGFVFVGLTKGSAGNETSLLSAASAYGFRQTTGSMYFARINGNTVEWDTYYGEDKGQWSVTTNWLYNIADFASFPPPATGGRHAWGGRGKLTYNDQLSTLFVGGSIMENGKYVETEYVPGFFRESIIHSASGSTYGRAEQFVTAFSNNTTGVSDRLTWGTHFGHSGEDEHLSDIETYTVGSDSYVAILGTTNTPSGVTAANVDKFPLVDLGNNAWFQSSNSFNAGNNSSLYITRFKVTNLKNHIGLEDYRLSEHLNWRVYPNPSSKSFKIHSFEDDQLLLVQVYDLNGKLLLKDTNVKSDEDEIDISNLPSGVYIVLINEMFSCKLIKE